LMPPNGASGSETRPWFTAAIPASTDSETRKTHFTCFAQTVAGEAKRPRGSQEVPPLPVGDVDRRMDDGQAKELCDLQVETTLLSRRSWSIDRTAWI
jgi:hypothetical protein